MMKSRKDVAATKNLQQQSNPELDLRTLTPQQLQDLLTYSEYERFVKEWACQCVDRFMLQSKGSGGDKVKPRRPPKSRPKTGKKPESPGSKV